eukprot:NODE_148_length_17471_cov_0.413136.p2 type:complete len:702 gc:universal NODE_148_length_17471_cov_0.413136:3035-930(-)
MSNSKSKHRKTIMLKFRSGNFVEEFHTIEEDKQNQFGDCIAFILQQTRRYTNGFLNVESQMTPFLDTQSEKSKQSNVNKVYILQHKDAKDLLKQLGRKRREVKNLKDEDRGKYRREINKLQRDMLDLERQLFQHFMGILHCLCEEYYLRLVDTNEELSDLRGTCEDLQRQKDLLELQHNGMSNGSTKVPESMSFKNAGSLTTEDDSQPTTIKTNDSSFSNFRTPDNSALKQQIKDLKNEIEDLYDELSLKERNNNSLSNLFQQIAIIIPSIPSDAIIPPALLQSNSSLIEDAKSLSLGDFDIEEFVSLLLKMSDYIFYLWDTTKSKQASRAPTPPSKNISRMRKLSSSSSSSTDSANNKSRLDAFFSTSNTNSPLKAENDKLKKEVEDLQLQLQSMHNAGNRISTDYKQEYLKLKDQLALELDLAEKRSQALQLKHQKEINDIQSTGSSDFKDQQVIINQLNSQLDELETANKNQALQLDSVDKSLANIRIKYFGQGLVANLYKSKCKTLKLEMQKLHDKSELNVESTKIEASKEFNTLNSKYLKLQKDHISIEKEKLDLSSQLKSKNTELSELQTVNKQITDRELRLNADIDGVFLEFTRVNGLLTELSNDNSNLKKELKESLKENGELKIKYDEMRFNMIAEGMDNEMLSGMMEGLKESYFEELEGKFKKIEDLENSVKELDMQNHKHLYNGVGKSTQT